MAARMKVIYGGNEYVSRAADGMTAFELEEIVNKGFETHMRLKLETEDGLLLMFCEDVVRGSILVFEEL